MPPFDDLSDTISEQALNIRNLLRPYEAYLPANRAWLRKNAPRRREPVGRDLPIFEAVYHFNYRPCHGCGGAAGLCRDRQLKPITVRPSTATPVL